MKPSVILPLIAAALAPSILPAANLFVPGDYPLTSTVNVSGTGNWYQIGGSTATYDINSGGSIVVTNPQYESMIGQNASGPVTLNLNTGGSMNFSGATGGGAILFVGNNLTSAIGILNLNGGTFDGSGITNFILGRDSGTGQVNISAGSMTIGDSTPLFDAVVTNGKVAGTSSYINFTSGSTGTLAITGYDLAAYTALWNANDLRFAGANSGAFADHFQVSGNTLSVIPEPSTALLSGSFLLMALVRRRR